jgi:hypothetical protein
MSTPTAEPSSQIEKDNLHEERLKATLEDRAVPVPEELTLSGWRLVAVASSVILSIFLV